MKINVENLELVYGIGNVKRIESTTENPFYYIISEDTVVNKYGVEVYNNFSNMSDSEYNIVKAVCSEIGVFGILELYCSMFTGEEHNSMMLVNKIITDKNQNRLLGFDEGVPVIKACTYNCIENSSMESGEGLLLIFDIHERFKEREYADIEFVLVKEDKTIKTFKKDKYNDLVTYVTNIRKCKETLNVVTYDENVCYIGNDEREINVASGTKNLELYMFGERTTEVEGVHDGAFLLGLRDEVFDVGIKKGICNDKEKIKVTKEYNCDFVDDHKCSIGDALKVNGEIVEVRFSKNTEIEDKGIKYSLDENCYIKKFEAIHREAEETTRIGIEVKVRKDRVDVEINELDARKSRNIEYKRDYKKLEANESSNNECTDDELPF